MGRSRFARPVPIPASLGARIVAVSRAPRVYVPMAGWKPAPWLLFYLAMLLADAAVIVAVVG